MISKTLKIHTANTKNKGKISGRRNNENDKSKYQGIE